MLKQKKRFIIALACQAIILVVTSCSQVLTNELPAKEVTLTSPATISVPSTEATAVMVTDTSPASTATQTAAPTASPEVDGTATSAQTGMSPTIGAVNAKDLVEMTESLPAHPDHFAWLGSKDTNIPAGDSPRPQLIMQIGSSMTTVTVDDKISLGRPYALLMNSDQILAFAPDGSSMVIQASGRVSAVGLDSKPIGTLEGVSPGDVSGVSYASSGQYVVITTRDKIQALVYNLADTSAGATRLEGFETAAPVYSAGITSDGRTLAWVSRATMQFQDVNAANSLPGAKLNFTDFIGAWNFSPDGSKVALYVAGNLSIYTVPGAQELVSITTGQPVNSIAWSPDGSLLAAGYGANLQLWESATLAPVASYPGPNAFTGEVSFSPDGRYIYSSHDNNIIGVWRVK